MGNKEKHQISRLTQAFNLQKFKRNQMVYKQGDIPKFVYVVHTGEFEVSTRVPASRTSKNDENKGQTLTAKDRKHIDVKIALFCSGKMLGSEDVIAKQPYTTSVKCLSTEGSLYLISCQEFLFKFSDKRTWATI